MNGRHKTAGLLRQTGRVILALGIGLLAFCSALWAGDLTLQASADRTRVAVGERVSLTVSMSAEGMGTAPTPDLVAPDGFDVLGNTSSSSTSISIVNGAMTTTRTVSFVYTLQAKREGSFLIGPARVTHQGKQYESLTIRVEVVKGSGRRQTRPVPAPGQSFNTRDLGEIEENLFIKAKPDKRAAYVGEQVRLSYKLYTRYDLQNVRYGHLPTYTGFWVEAVYDAQRLDLKREVVDGRAFNAALLKVMALFPTSAGNQALEQLEVVCDISVRSRRSAFDFDSFFDFGKTKQVTVRSEEVALEVLPLPPGAPAGFNGAVGRFQISAEATPTTVAAGDPIALKVTVSGTGNLNSVSEPIRPSEGSYRFYDPKVSVKTEKRGNRFGGRKTFEYVVIPREAGGGGMRPFRLSYFDPDRKGYATVETAPIALVVTPGAKSPQPAPSPMLSRGEIKVLGEDIRYIKPDRPFLEAQGGALYRDWWFLGLQAAPVLGFLGVFAYKRRRERLMGDVAYARRLRSRSEARRRLVEARRLMRSGENGAFHSEIYRAVAEFLADRLNVPAAGMTADSVAEALADQGVSPEVVSQVRTVFQQCDFARFAPAQILNGEMETLYKTAEGLIDELGGKI